MDLLTTENNSNHHHPSSIPIERMDIIDLETDTEQFERQIEELTKQLNESKSIEKHAKDECAKYYQLYNETKQSFLNYENQIHRILNNFTYTLNSSFQSNNDQEKIEFDSNEILNQITSLMDLNEKLIRQCADQNDKNTQLHDEISILQLNYEKEKQIRHEFETKLTEANKLIEMDHSKRLQKLRNYASLADDEGDILLSSLMKKAEKNDMDLNEIKQQYKTFILEQNNEIKKLIKERELLHLYIQRLERENILLSSRTNHDQTIQLLTHSSQTSNTLEEAKQLIEQLRIELIEQIKFQDKLTNDIQQIQHNYKIDLHEREQIEEYLTRELDTAKDQIQTIQSEYEHVIIVRNTLQHELENSMNEFMKMKGVTNSLIDNFKQQMENISLEKANLEEENLILRDQIQKLKIDFENSESVQHDFVKLSQALQVQLEEFRNAGNELRWQHEEDFSECQQCHVPFSMTWRKQHCHHCGKVLCKECVNKTILSGPNKRPSRVCDICYTLLNKTSQPYFADVQTDI